MVDTSPSQTLKLRIIRSQPQGLTHGLIDLWHSRELLWLWTQRGVRVRYKQAFLGIAWAAIQPLVMMGVFTVVFSRIFQVPSDGLPYPVFSYSALLPWGFLTAAVSASTTSVVANGTLVRLIYIPRVIFPISSSLLALVDFFIGAIIFIGLIIFYGIPVSAQVSWVFLLLSLQIILVFGLSLFVSALNVFFRDVQHLISLILQVWMYATPIIYSVNSVPERLRGLYALNPMVGIVDGYRRTILMGESPNWNYLSISITASIIILLTGYFLFKHYEMRFADVI